MSPVIYILHSGQLYGTERMAMATLMELHPWCAPMLLAPPGPVHAEAERRGIESRVFTSVPSLAQTLWPLLLKQQVRVLSTSVSQAAVVWLLGTLLGRNPRHIHVVHGGADERLSYGRKRWLPFFGVQLVAVSAYVRERLLAHRCAVQRITVIENFLTGEFPQCPPQRRPGPTRVCMVTRLDPIKRVDLAVRAWQTLPKTADRPHLRICGTGWQNDELRQMAAVTPEIEFAGFVPDTLRELSRSDFYLHTCDREPFGLAVLEAMAVGVPVIVPDQGGAGSLVENGRSGFHYRAGDVVDLQRTLEKVMTLSPSDRAAVVQEARHGLLTRFAAKERSKDYAELLGLEMRHERS